MGIVVDYVGGDEFKKKIKIKKSQFGSVTLDALPAEVHFS